MTNRKLSVALFAAAGLFGLQHQANADVGAATVLKVFGSSTKDVATRITTGSTTTAARLRNSQNTQPGHEQPAIAMFSGPNGDNITGIYVDRASSLYVPGTTTPALLPVDNGDGGGQNDRPAQGAMAMFQLAADPVSGAVSAKLLSSYTPTFITQHDSQQYRAFNQPNAYAINGGSAIAVEYNYRPQHNNNDNRTKRYLMVFNIKGQQILTVNGTASEKQIYAKTNDDCNMNMDGHAGVVADVYAANKYDATQPATSLTSHIVMWRGCNGNGADEGWMDVMDITCDSATAPTSCTHTDLFDIALDQQEQRSRGYCSVDIANRYTAVCSWTAGNDEPQKDGVWLAASDITPGKYSGRDQKQAVLWSTMIDGRKAAVLNSDGSTAVPATYSQRAMHERVMVYNPATKALEPSSYIIWRSGDARGGNGDNRKEGTYYRDNIGLFQIDSTTNKLNTVMPLTDYSQQLLGLDGTHLGVSSIVMGQTDSLAAQQPGLMLYVGSHTGGGTPAQINYLRVDAAPAPATASSAAIAPSRVMIAGTASTGAASFDRHLYPNYLGQNPGNQGRNFSAALTVVNPFCDDAATSTCDRVLSIMATTGKDPKEVANVTTSPVQDTCYASDDATTAYKCAQLKLSSYITVIPVAQHQPGSGTGGGSGMGSGSGSNVGQGSGSGSSTGSGSGSSTGSGSDSTDPGTTLGGCSTGGGAGGALSFLLIGLAAFIRRRR